MKNYEDLIWKYHNKYPYLSHRQLAKIILEREKLSYQFDTFRKIIARIRNVAPSQDFEKNTEVLEIPESLYEEENNYIIDPEFSRIAILNDIHIPFHDKNALHTAIEYVVNFDPDLIILNGDILDCYSISRYSRNPNLKDYNQEIQIGLKFLEFLRSKFPTPQIVYKFGNHEERLQFYIWNRAEELNNIEEIRLEYLLKFHKFGISTVTATQIIEGTHFFVAHGHEIYASAGMVNIARNMRLKAFENVIVGHFHRTQEDIWTTISGKPIGGWTVGCLCGLRPAYRPISFWNHGFATVEVYNDTFSVQNKKIIGDKVK
ncbi:MAG: metallophosphoesterase [Ignavibacteria bacterium]|nr:metallophosphoesterase [Ignavibacteria bacterium]